MHLVHIEKTLDRWIDRLVSLKEEWIKIKTVILQFTRMNEYANKLEMVEDHVEEILKVETLIAIMRHEVSVSLVSIKNCGTNEVDGWLSVFSHEMILLEQWHVKLIAKIAELYHVEVRMAS